MQSLVNVVQGLIKLILSRGILFLAGALSHSLKRNAFQGGPGPGLGLRREGGFFFFTT